MKRVRTLLFLTLALALAGCCVPDDEIHREISAAKNDLRRELHQARDEVRSSLREAREELRQSSHEARRELRRALRDLHDCW